MTTIPILQHGDWYSLTKTLVDLPIISHLNMLPEYIRNEHACVPATVARHIALNHHDFIDRSVLRLLVIGDDKLPGHLLPIYGVIGELLNWSPHISLSLLRGVGSLFPEGTDLLLPGIEGKFKGDIELLNVPLAAFVGGNPCLGEQFDLVVILQSAASDWLSLAESEGEWPRVNGCFIPNTYNDIRNTTTSCSQPLLLPSSRLPTKEEITLLRRITEEDDPFAGYIGLTEPFPAWHDLPVFGHEVKTPLHYAAATNDAWWVDWLLTQGANPCLADDLGYFPIHYAAMTNNTGTLDALISNGDNMDVLSTLDHLPPIAVAIRAKAYNAVMVLLEYGADITTPIFGGMTIVEFASHYECDDEDVTMMLADFYRQAVEDE